MQNPYKQNIFFSESAVRGIYKTPTELLISFPSSYFLPVRLGRIYDRIYGSATIIYTCTLSFFYENIEAQILLNLKNIYAEITQFSQLFLRSNNKAENPNLIKNGSFWAFLTKFGPKFGQFMTSTIKSWKKFRTQNIEAAFEGKVKNMQKS